MPPPPTAFDDEPTFGGPAGDQEGSFDIPAGGEETANGGPTGGEETANGGPGAEPPPVEVAANGGPHAEPPAGDVAANGGPRAKPPAGEAPATRTVERVASADFPPVVAPKSDHYLLFAIGKRAVYGASTGLSITVPVETREITIRAVVYAPEFTVFDMAGEEQAWTDLTVDVTEGGGATAKGQLMLHANDVAAKTPTSIFITFYRGSLPAGQLELATVIDPRYVAPGASDGVVKVPAATAEVLIDAVG